MHQFFFIQKVFSVCCKFHSFPSDMNLFNEMGNGIA